MGVLLAVTALLCWGIGDFLIQRSARAFGDWSALFFIVFLGSVVLTPFALLDLRSITIDTLGYVVLSATSIVILAASLINFEALKRGKLAVIESLWANEILITVLIGSLLLREQMSLPQALLVVLIVIGILLTSTRSLHHVKRLHAEKGVWLALFGTLLMGSADVLYGIGARETSAVVINWVACVFILIACTVYLTIRGQWSHVKRDLNEHPLLVLFMSIFDNAAWLAYAASMTFIPVAIATSISQSYIAIAAVLGIRLNKEHLKRHQVLGLIVSVVSVIALALIS